MYNQGGATRGESAQWTREEDMVFEQALAEGMTDWDAVAAWLPNKTPAQVAAHYSDLVHDVAEIDAGRVELPDYGGAAGEDQFGGAAWEAPEQQISFGGAKAAKHDPDRKKGTPWTEDEHRLFLKGLELYGKGDWRSISRNCVVTRTPTQVASHAQKYYLRQGSGKKERKRSSIHDITTSDTALVQAHPAHGQNNGNGLPQLANNPLMLAQQQQQNMPEFFQQMNNNPNQPGYPAPLRQVHPRDFHNYDFPK